MKVFESEKIEKRLGLLLLIAAVLLGALALGAIQDLFAPTPTLGNTITVSGEGTVTAIPDIATITFSVYEEGKTVGEAQDKAAKNSNAALEAVRTFGIEERDVKTLSYNVSPEYSRPQPCFNGVCPEYDRTIIGYTTSQSVQIKVRDTDKAGDVLTALGNAGVSNLSGPNFTIDDPEALRAEAREMAIEDAREKAKELAGDLRVRIVRVASFSEGGYYPKYFAETAAYGVGGDSAVRNIPELPVGEDEITVNVSITYEIR